MVICEFIYPLRFIYKIYQIVSLMANTNSKTPLTGVPYNVFLFCGFFFCQDAATEPFSSMNAKSSGYNS